ncbi:WD40-repeat-containing domain protein [Catenaria anguillulae PL171]|uniref:WD40-repeat-containing domain protein n=1 Tax=Catenaria anguillulae PL171 TaxID=765915 RepID=A0A1Y2HSY0_9FUNG|nr:WD40-repeat-containing domain protein [Catenaria anguillulae PL171]
MPVLRITAGSYERLLFGYAVDTTSQLSTQLFGFGAHIGCIKSMAISAKGGGVLCTGGQDELIKVYSLKSMRAMGELFAHNATVSQIEAFGKTHVLSGDEQGKLIMWRTKDWEPLTTLKGHKAAITGIAIHPSGKLALTVSSDRQLICWNLLRGLKATKSRLPDTPFAIHFSPTGVHYAILFNHSLVIYDTASTSSIAVHASPRTRLNAFAFVDDHRFVVGSEDGLVTMLEMSEEEEQDDDGQEEDDDESEERAIRVVAHFAREDASTRIRSVIVHAFTPDADADQTSDDEADDDQANVHVKPHGANVEYYLAAASSSGIVSVWGIPRASPRIGEAAKKVDPITELDTKCRLTCLAMDAIDGELVPDNEEESDAEASEGVQSDAEMEEMQEEQEEAEAPKPSPASAASKKRKAVAEAPVDAATDGMAHGSEASQSKRKRAKKNKNKQQA